jgi:hypothetical protein
MNKIDKQRRNWNKCEEWDEKKILKKVLKYSCEFTGFTEKIRFHFQVY